MIAGRYGDRAQWAADPAFTGTYARPGGDWAAGTYGPNVLVRYHGGVYRSLATTTAVPTDSTRWEELVPPDPLVAGTWIFTRSQEGSSTSATMGVGSLRLTPWVVTDVGRGIDRMAIDVTSAGEAGALIRLGLYGDDGTGYPGGLVLDAGTVAGDAVAIATATVNQAITPGIWWVAAAVQNVVTTQPTVRAVGSGGMPVRIRTGSANGSAANLGYTMGSVTGALPATLSGLGTAGSAPRIQVRIQ